MKQGTSNPVKFPTATVHEHRLRLFQATRRPKRIEQEIVSAWGKVWIEGRLGQAHADLFEAFCFEREDKAELEDGRIKILVDPYRARKRANIQSGDGQRKLCNDLQTTLIRIMEPKKYACTGHLVDHIDEACRKDGTAVTRYNPLSRGERPLWKIEIGKAFCKLVEADIWIGYDPARIAALETGIAQAVARHVLTHKTMPNGGWSLDGLIEAVAGELSSDSARNRRREIRADAARLRAAGVIIDGDRIFKAGRGAV